MEPYRHSRSKQAVVRRRKAPLASAATALLLVVAAFGLAGIGFVLGQKFGQSAVTTTRPKLTTPITAPTPAPDTPQPPQGPLTLLTAGTTETPIIMYHDVLPDKQVWFDLTTDEFAQQ